MEEGQAMRKAQRHSGKKYQCYDGNKHTTKVTCVCVCTPPCECIHACMCVLVGVLGCAHISCHVFTCVHMHMQCIPVFLHTLKYTQVCLCWGLGHLCQPRPTTGIQTGTAPGLVQPQGYKPALHPALSNHRIQTGTAPGLVQPQGYTPAL